MFGALIEFLSLQRGTLTSKEESDEEEEEDIDFDDDDFEGVVLHLLIVKLAFSFVSMRTVTLLLKGKMVLFLRKNILPSFAPKEMHEFLTTFSWCSCPDSRTSHCSLFFGFTFKEKRSLGWAGGKGDVQN